MQVSGAQSPLQGQMQDGLMLDEPHVGMEVARSQYDTGPIPTPSQPSYQLSYSHAHQNTFVLFSPDTLQHPSIPASSRRSTLSTSQPEKETYLPTLSDRRAAILSISAVERRKRLWFAVAAILVIVITVAGILGGILGTRAAQSSTNSNNTNVQSSANAQSPTDGQRIRSTSGVWNGTGLAMIFQAQAWVTGPSHWAAYYQDCNGSLTLQAFDYNGFSSTIEPTTDANNKIVVENPPDSAKLEYPKAANGTGIGGTWIDWPDRNISYYIISYVAEDGTLSDLWTDSTKPWGPFTPGNLSGMGWKAPTDNRPAMSLFQGWGPFGKGNGTGGFHLYSGGLDGSIHQYSYDMATGTWADSDFVLPGSYAYGGIKAQGYFDPNDATWHNNTLYTTDHNGQLMYYVQKTDDDKAVWPLGGTIGKPVMSGQFAAVNSSLAQSQRLPWGVSNSVYFPSNSTGTLNALSLTGVPTSELGLWNGAPVQAGPVSGLKTIPGTEFAQFIDNLPGAPTYLIYQDTGNSLAWATVTSASLIQTGKLVGP